MWMDDGATYLQARDGASCTGSKPQGNINTIMNMYQNPENFLRQNISPSKVPVGQTDQSEQNDENLDFETFLNNRPVPFLFEEDENKCPVEQFGLSITPVCLNSLKGSAVRDPGSWFTLYDVDPCRSYFRNSIVMELRARSGVNSATDISNAPCSDGEELWCCREITSEVILASFSDLYWNWRMSNITSFSRYTPVAMISHTAMKIST